MALLLRESQQYSHKNQKNNSQGKIKHVGPFENQNNTSFEGREHAILIINYSDNHIKPQIIEYMPTKNANEPTKNNKKG